MVGREKLMAGSTTTLPPLVGIWSGPSPFTSMPSPPWSLVLQGHDIPFWKAVDGANSTLWPDFLFFCVGPKIMQPLKWVPEGGISIFVHKIDPPLNENPRDKN